MNLARLRDDFRRGVDIAQPPAGDGIRFGKRVAGDDPGKRPRQCGAINVFVRAIDDVFVWFVGDDKGVVLLRELQDFQKFGARENLASGIGRITDDDGFWFLREGAGKFVRIKMTVEKSYFSKPNLQ